MPVTAGAIDVVVKWTGNDWGGRDFGNHALFTPHCPAEHPAQPVSGLGRAFACSQQVPAHAEVTRPALEADGSPVAGRESIAEEPVATSLPAVESTAVLPQLPGEQRPALQGWSDIDEHLHRVDRDLAPLPGGWWWSCCDKTVTRGQPRDLDQVPVEQLCLRCWDVPTLLAERRERQRQAAESASSER
jgi:hypothetical protein